MVGELQGYPHPVPPSCVRLVISSDPGYIAINVKDPMAEHDVLTLPMLRDKCFLVLSEEKSPKGYRITREICLRAGFTPRETQKVASIETLMLYVEMGAGVTVLSGNNRLMSDPNIRLIPLKAIQFDVVAYWREASMPEAVRSVLNAVQ